MSPKTPNPIEFALVVDRTLPSYLAEGEIAALYGTNIVQVRRWKRELQETGTLSNPDPLPEDRRELCSRIITGALKAILDVVEMPTEGLSPREKIKHMEACGAVLPRVAPYAEEPETQQEMSADEALEKVLRATRSAEKYRPERLH